MKQQSKIVILAGSGRSGTTWLGSILNSYEKAEYFYEICAYPELHFTSENLLKNKYPLTYWLPKRYPITDNIERKILTYIKKWAIVGNWTDRALRLNPQHTFNKASVDVDVFKIVKLFSFAQELPSLLDELGDRLKVIHIIRNPYSQLMSEMRIDARNPEGSRAHFKQRIEAVIENSQLQKYHELAKRYKDASWIEQMTLIWWISNELMVNVEQERIYRIIYEDFARDPLEQTQQMFSFLGWNFSDQTKQYVLKTSNIKESSPGLFSIKKNAHEAINRWRDEISLEDYEQVKNLLHECNLLKFWTEKDLSYSS